jgi:RHS repeat-associated protein
VAEYAYDSNGNCLGGPGLAAPPEYDAQDRLTVYGARSYEYTANGEIFRKTDGSAVTEYDYDVFGNLRRVTLPSGNVIEYVSDTLNRRVSRATTTNSGTQIRHWVYDDQLRVAAELDASGGIVERFVYASRSNVPDYVERDGARFRLICDNIGSVRLVVDASTGDVIQERQYDEYGRVTLDTNPGWQPFGFAGGLYDPEIALVRFGLRDYDASTGRWTVKDPIGFNGGDTNLYGYAINDPINRIDPYGLYGTNDCSYYTGRCAESGGRYYCETAPYFCELFPMPLDPDPTRDDDYEGAIRCIRQCLQDCDRAANRGQDMCPLELDPSTDNFWDPRNAGCHAACYAMCAQEPGSEIGAL